MPSHRSLRMAEAIREVVATAILFDVADPRVRAVTVLRVEVSGDLRQRHGLRVDHGDRGRAEAGAPRASSTRRASSKLGWRRGCRPGSRRS